MEIIRTEEKDRCKNFTITTIVIKFGKTHLGYYLTSQSTGH